MTMRITLIPGGAGPGAGGRALFRPATALGAQLVGAHRRAETGRHADHIVSGCWGYRRGAVLVRSGGG